MPHAVPAQLVLALAALHVSAAAVFLYLHAAVRTRLSVQNDFEVCKRSAEVWHRPTLKLHLVVPGLFTDRTHKRIAAVR